MARYTPPEQSKAGQVFDIAVVVVAIFVALWLPLTLILAGIAIATTADSAQSYMPPKVLPSKPSPPDEPHEDWPPPEEPLLSSSE